VTKVEITRTAQDGVIPKEAFKDCTNIADIIIDGGGTIVDNAFENCTALKNLYIPKSIQNIGETILADCTKLENLTVPFIGSGISDENTETSVLGGFFGYTDDSAYTKQYYNDNGESHFYKIPKSLKNVSVLNQTNIPTGAFSSCDNIESVAIVHGANMGKQAFYNCKNLKNVTLPNDLLVIGNQAFADCSALERINIPSRVTTIGEQTFYGCNSLENITMPDSISNIADNIFNRVSIMAVDTGLQITCSENSYAYQYAAQHDISTNVVSSDELNVKKTATTVSCLSDNSYMLDVINASNVTGTLRVKMYDSNNNIIGEKTMEVSDVEHRVQLNGYEMENVAAITVDIEYPNDEGETVSTASENISSDKIPQTEINETTLSYDSGYITLDGDAIKPGMTLIQAIYKDDKTLDKIKTYTVESISDSVKVENFTAGNAKFMLWESLENMTPVAEEITE
jgi:hypothetical protein